MSTAKVKGRGKVGKQKPKSEKHAAVLKSLLEVKGLPEEIGGLLADVTSPKDLDVNKTENLMRFLKRFMMDGTSRLLDGKGSSPEELSALTSDMYTCVAAVKWVVDSMDSEELKRIYSITRISSMFASLLVADKLEFRLRNQMCAVCEKLIGLGFVDDEDAEAGVLMLVFLLDLTLGKTGVLKSDVKRVWAVNCVIRRLNLMQPVLAALFDKLMSTVTSKRYLEVKEGRQHIGHFLGLDARLVKPAYDRILAELPKMSKNAGSHYGEVLVIAWNHSAPAARKKIEETCIQDLMRRIFTLKRNGLNFEKTGQLVFGILQHLHDSRRAYPFSSAITTLYTPLIWRSLRSGHPLERCNAAQVFMHAFPLEKSAGGITENIQFKEKQFKEIVDLLVDDYHFVRIIAIRGVCHHLMETIECFAVIEVKTLLKTLADTLANDGSTYLVRLAVFEGFAEMVKKKESAQLLESILPQMKLHIHDENEKVRCAFVKILQNVKDHPDTMSIKYWDIVPIDHLAARLELEGPVVGEPLVRLMMSNFYIPGEPLNKVVSRVIRLVKMNPKAARRLFQHSVKVITVKDVHAIIIALLAYLRQKAKEALEEVQKENEENERSGQEAGNASPVNRHKRKKKKEVLTDIANFQGDQRDKSNDSRNETETNNDNNGVGDGGDGTNEGPPRPNEAAVDELSVCRGLLEAACTAWLVFSEQLNQPENEKYLADLYTLAVATIPLFLRCYRGTDMYYSSVYFASLVPINKLAPVSTVSGACLSELREVTATTPPSQVKCLIYSLCAWNRGQQVIDLVIEWLNQAFREQNLNMTAIQLQKEGHRRRKVRFKLMPGKPLLGLKLLGYLFDDVINEKRLLDKTYEHIYDLFMYLERAKILLERRMEHGGPLPEEELSDTFLVQLLRRYLELGNTLHKPNAKPKPAGPGSDLEDIFQPVDAPKFFVSNMEWASSVLMRGLPSDPVEISPAEERPLAVSCLMEVFVNATRAVQFNTTDKLHCQNLAGFAIQLLSTGYAIWFVEQALVVVQSLVAHAEVYTTNDEWQLLKVIIPSLYSKCLDVFVTSQLGPDNLRHCITGKGNKVKNSLQSYMMTVSRVFGSKSELATEIVAMLMNCCVHILAQKIREDKEEEGQSQDEPFFVSLILKVLLQNGKSCSQVLPTFNKFFSKYKQEGLLLGSCFSLLDLVVKSSKDKFKRPKLEETMQIAFRTINEYKKAQAQVNTAVENSADSSFFSDEPSIDIIRHSEGILFELGKLACCTLWPTNSVA